MEFNLRRKNGQTTDEIYENENVIKETNGKEITGSECVCMRHRSSRAAAVCLLLLCVLLLTAVIVLCVMFTQERQLTSNFNFTNEGIQLQTKITSLTELNIQLNQEKNELTTLLQEGWTYYKSSFYYMSNETKNWTESRRYCTERGADLVIINSTEEQDFVQKISCGTQVWIGLTYRNVENTWKWVDGSMLISGFWKCEEPTGYINEKCVVIHPSGWTVYQCTSVYQWICKKKK